MDTSNWITIIAILAAALSGVIGFVVSGLVGRGARTETKQSESAEVIAAIKALIDERGPRHERAEDRQTHQGETLAGVAARVTNLEDSSAIVADAVQRLVRMEEWRTHADPKLNEVERTARAVAGIQSDVKTLFKSVEEMPDVIVDTLMARVRTQPRVAVNG